MTKIYFIVKLRDDGILIFNYLTLRLRSGGGEEIASLVSLPLRLRSGCGKESIYVKIPL